MPLAERRRVTPRESEKNDAATSTRKHLRGSSLLAFGRILSLCLNFFVQLLAVWYLTKPDYGAFSWALSIVATSASLILVAQNRVIARFVPIYQERRDHGSVFGTLLLALGMIAALGLALCVVVIGLEGVFARRVVSDPKSVSLLVVLIALAPVQAFDNAFQSLLAVFADPKAIFFRRHVLGPVLKLLAVLAVITFRGDVYWLAIGYLAGGGIGVSIYVALLVKVLRRERTLEHFHRHELRFHPGENLRFSLPLFGNDVLAALKFTAAIVLIEALLGTEEVAGFRAVMPVAGLNLIILQGMKILYTPVASRLWERGDHRGLEDLYWRSALWTALATFPVFAVSVCLADEVTATLFGERYEGAGRILVPLAVGQYISATLGLNSHTLMAKGRVLTLLANSAVAVVVGIVLNLWLIPEGGAASAALGTACALVVYNLLNQFVLLRDNARTRVHSAARDPLAAQGDENTTRPTLTRASLGRVYLTLVAASGLVWATAQWLTPPPLVLLGLIAVLSIALLRINRGALDILQTFPALSRLPLSSWLFSNEESR